MIKIPTFIGARPQFITAATASRKVVVTTWVEVVDAGWNRIVPPTESESIVNAVRNAKGAKGREIAPYGSGAASASIVAALLEHPY